MAVKEEKKDKEKVDQVITAVYKVNLHCPQCISEIKKPLMRTQGVHNVDVNTEKSEIKVKGVIDVIKIQKLIEKLSKKKVELISPQPPPQVKIKDKESATTEKKVKATKEPIIRTTSIKVHLHCDKCEHDLRKKLLKHKGIYSVKTDMKAQTLTVQGTIESDKLLSYMRKKANKHAEIITSKPEKKEEKKEKPKVEAEKKEEKKENPKVEAGKEEEKKENPKVETEKKEEKKENPKVEAEKKEEKKENPKVEAKSTYSNAVIEFEEVKVVEVKNKESNNPYFIHYVYAPQLFSDENPNACCIM